MSEPRLQLKIETVADLKAAMSAEAAWQREIALMERLGQDASKLKDQLSAQQAVLAKFEAPKMEGGGLGAKLGEGVTEALGEVKNMVPGLGAVSGAFAGVAGAAALAEKSVEAFAEKQAAVTSLDAALANTGQLTDAVRERTQKLAEEMERETSISEESWIRAETTLIKHGTTLDNIGERMEFVKNVAGALGIGVEEAGNMVGRALEGKFRGFERLGFQIDKTATQTEKLEAIMQQAATIGAGQLEARSQTLTGTFTQLWNESKHVFEGFGALITGGGILQGMVQELSHWFAALASTLPQTVEQVQGLQNKAVDPAAKSIAQYRRELGLAASGETELGDDAEGGSEKVDKLTGSVEKSKTVLEQQKEAIDAVTKSLVANLKADEELAEEELRALKIKTGMSDEEFDRRKAELHGTTTIESLKAQREGLSATKGAADQQAAEADAREQAAREAAEQAKAKLGDATQYNKDKTYVSLYEEQKKKLETLAPKGQLQPVAPDGYSSYEDYRRDVEEKQRLMQAGRVRYYEAKKNVDSHAGAPGSDSDTTALSKREADLEAAHAKALKEKEEAERTASQAEKELELNRKALAAAELKRQNDLAEHAAKSQASVEKLQNQDEIKRLKIQMDKDGITAEEKAALRNRISVLKNNVRQVDLRGKGEAERESAAVDFAKDQADTEKQNRQDIEKEKKEREKTVREAERAALELQKAQAQSRAASAKAGGDKTGAALYEAEAKQIGAEEKSLKSQPTAQSQPVADALTTYGQSNVENTQALITIIQQLTQQNTQLKQQMQNIRTQ